MNPKDKQIDQITQMRAQGIDRMNVEIICGDCDALEAFLYLYRCFKCSVYVCGKCKDNHSC